MSMVYPVMKHNDTMIYVYKFSLIVLERESSVRTDACIKHDDVKDLPAPQTPLTVSNVANETVIISSEF